MIMQLLNDIYTLALNLVLLGSIGVLACSLTGIIYVVVEGHDHDDNCH